MTASHVPIEDKYSFVISTKEIYVLLMKLEISKCADFDLCKCSLKKNDCVSIDTDLFNSGYLTCVNIIFHYDEFHY